jgi:hypothetical protein
MADASSWAVAIEREEEDLSARFVSQNFSDG